MTIRDALLQVIQDSALFNLMDIDVVWREERTPIDFANEGNISNEFYKIYCYV